jgi:hypothetical protein
MSKWTDEHVWVIEAYIGNSWRRTRFKYGRMGLHGKMTPKMTLTAAMSNIRHWHLCEPNYTLRMRNVWTRDIILGDILY